ncbi:hypothetical protein niasHT_003184 [Heterodera trifolii]|uniref:DNA-directed DNA polymerase n=1 Tax=Heterodera trifolii TaxID=157864 RepID=A0ABD2LNZ2_9BILA
MVAKTRGWPRWKFHRYVHSLHGQQGCLRRDALQLMQQIGVRTGRNTYDAEICVPRVVDHWNNSQQQHRFAVFIFGSSGQYKPLYKYINDHYDTPIVLYLNNQHFDGVQKLHGLFGQHYCLDCEKPYQRPSTHLNSCKARCLLCSRVGPEFPCVPSGGFFHQCGGCNKKFRNNGCLQHHLASNFCAQSKKCKDCGVIWDTRVHNRDGRKGHKCHETYCQLCNTFYNPERGCFIQPIEPKEQDPYRIVAFDLETMQHQPVDPQQPEKREHQPNFIAARVACPECIESGNWRRATAGCRICGSHRTVAFCQRPFEDTRVDKRVVADNPLQAFVDWLIFQLPAKYDTYAYSHFGGRFDMVLVFRELFRIGFNPEMLRRGNKMYEMKVRKQKRRNPNIVFRDSFNLMPCALAALIPSYGLDVEDKPFFPHLANRPENYGHEIHPTPDDYLASGMMPSKRQKFDEWYAEHRHEPFKLDEALASYCTNDVEILMAALVAFRREFFEISRRQHYIDGIDDKENHDGIDVLLRSAATHSDSLSTAGFEQALNHNTAASSVLLCGLLHHFLLFVVLEFIVLLLNDGLLFAEPVAKVRYKFAEVFGHGRSQDRHSSARHSCPITVQIFIKNWHNLPKFPAKGKGRKKE